jgi:hypothetical protein
VVSTVSGKLPATFLCVWTAWIVLTASLDPQELAVGAVVSLLVAVLSYDLLFHGKVSEKLQPKRWAYAIAYLPAYIPIRRVFGRFYRYIRPEYVGDLNTYLFWVVVGLLLIFVPVVIVMEAS